MASDRKLSIKVGVLADKRKAKSIWIDEYWTPAAVVEGDVALEPGQVVLQEEGVTRYFLGHTQVICHASDVDGYLHNLQSRTPAVYVVLRRNEDGRHPLPWYAHAVTVSSNEAQALQEATEDIVDKVPYPPHLRALVHDFVARHHRIEPFKKRQRAPHTIEEQKFGKEPIFLKSPNRQSGGDHE